MSDQIEMFVNHDPRWRQSFDHEREVISSLVHPWLAAPLEHVGATAVPGLHARPVVDILAPVASAADAAAAADALHRAGWAPSGDNPGVAERVMTSSRRSPGRQLRLFLACAASARCLVGFRDALRANACLRVEYDALRRWLTLRGGEQRHHHEAVNAKGAFVHQVLRQAGVESSSRPRIPAGAAAAH